METQTRQEQAPPPPRGPRPPLRRSDQRSIAGVAGGLAEHFDIDVTVVRIVFVVLCVFGGAGIAAYGAGWLLMPDSHGRSGLDELPALRNPAILAIVVLALLVAFCGPWWHFGRALGPATLVVAGVLLVVTSTRRARPAPPPPPSNPTTGGPPPPPPSPASTARHEEPTAGAATEPASYGESSRTQQLVGRAGPSAPPPPSPPAPPQVPSAPRRHLRLRTPWVTLGALGLMCALSGVLALGGVGTSTILAVDLLLAGVALVAGAWLRRSDGLIAVGVLLVAALAIGGALPVSYSAGTGERSFRPTSVGQLQSYELFAGRQVIDLRSLDLPTTGTVGVRVEQDFGSVEVLVPESTRVTISSRVRVGAQDLLGHNSDGFGNHEPSLIDTPAGAGATATIDIDIELAVGRVEVRRDNA